jgi:8-oxo-dGTP pyrophosphatase MutT (NUDIX family)
MARILSEKVVFQNQWIEVLSREVEGEPGPPYYAVRTPDYANVLALTEDRQVLLVRQFRPAVGSETLEFPGGLVDPGETPQQTVGRELLEETGFAAERIELLGSLCTDTGRLTNRLWCFFARDVRLVNSSRELQVVSMPLQEFEARIADGRFDAALHLAIYGLATARGCLRHLTAG